MDWIASALILLGFWKATGGNPSAWLLYAFGEGLYTIWAIQNDSPALAVICVLFGLVGLRAWQRARLS